jgi:hypothetical protein
MATDMWKKTQYGANVEKNDREEDGIKAGQEPDDGDGLALAQATVTTRSTLAPGKNVWRAALLARRR